MKTRLISIIWAMTFILPAGAQNDAQAPSAFIGAGMLSIRQIEPGGIRFQAPALDFGTRSSHRNWSTVTEYEFRAGFTTRQVYGHEASAIYLRPVDLAICYQLDAGMATLKAGPFLTLDYRVVYLPEQSGTDFIMMMGMNAGVQAGLSLRAGSALLDLTLRNSLTGLFCQNEIYRDDAYYWRNPGAFLRDIHQNGRTFSPAGYSDTSVEIRFRWNEASHLAVAWCGEYARYRQVEGIEAFQQSIRLYIRPAENRSMKKPKDI